jgi:UDP-N-acetylglucosamine--N-acetylmuramyl-(pentapeptide) pyrophosphoryl-undecaprenol N-acetylglucosamine transferase
VTTLLVASTGGHLKELHHLHRRLAGVEGPYRWVTFDTPQSRSLLAGEAVEFVPFVGGRDPLNVARNFPQAHGALRGGEVDTVVSTGSAVALPFFALARARRIRCHYIESAARIDAPSLTGRLIGRVPGVNRYSQYRGWRRRGWSFGGSVFDSFAPGPDRGARRGALAKVVVTLGTYRGYPFTRLVRRLLEVLPSEAEVLWQTGDTDVSGLGIAGHRAIPERDLSEAMDEADVVVAHAGVGTALAAFEVGKCPLLVPRRFALGEHVDDHQPQIAGELGDRGLSVSVDADELSFGDLLAAAAGSVASPAQAPVFATSGERCGAAPRSRSENSS